MLETLTIGMEEFDRVRPLWELLIRANADNSPYFKELYGTFEFEVRKGFLREKLAAGAEMYTVLLADPDAGVDAGFVTVTCDRAASFGEVEMLYLREEYRGRGLGRQLFRLGLDRLDSLGIRERKLCVTYGNEAALRLYQSFGFYPFTIDCIQKEQ